MAPDFWPKFEKYAFTKGWKLSSKQIIRQLVQQADEMQTRYLEAVEANVQVDMAYAAACKDARKKGEIFFPKEYSNFRKHCIQTLGVSLETNSMETSDNDFELCL